MVCGMKGFQLVDAYEKDDRILALEYCSYTSSESFMQGHDYRIQKDQDLAFHQTHRTGGIC